MTTTTIDTITDSQIATPCFDVIGVGPATLQCLREADGASVREDLLATADSRWTCSHSTSIGCESELWTVQVPGYPGIEEDLDRDPAVVIYGVSADFAPEYRVIVGERGNEQGHVVDVAGDGTLADARRTLDRELRSYGGDGWGRVEYRREGGWDRLD